MWRLRRRSRRARNVIEDDESIDGAITDTSVTCRTLNATGSSSVSSQSEIINTEVSKTAQSVDFFVALLKIVRVLFVNIFFILFITNIHT